MDQRIISAIRNKQILALLYERELKDVEPYVYGRFANGKIVLFGWQLNGQFPDWRIIYTHRIQKIYPSERIFDPSKRAHWNTRQLDFAELYEELTA